MVPDCNLFGDPLPAKPEEDELGRTVLWAARLVVSKRFSAGHLPGDISREDLISEIAIGTWRRARNYRDIGKKTLKEFTYKSAEWTWMEYWRNEYRRKRKAYRAGTIDVMDLGLVCRQEDMDEGRTEGLPALPDLSRFEADEPPAGRGQSLLFGKETA